MLFPLGTKYKSVAHVRAEFVDSPISPCFCVCFSCLMRLSVRFCEPP